MTRQELRPSWVSAAVYRSRTTLQTPLQTRFVGQKTAEIGEKGAWRLAKLLPRTRRTSVRPRPFFPLHVGTSRHAPGCAAIAAPICGPPVAGLDQKGRGRTLSLARCRKATQPRKARPRGRHRRRRVRGVNWQATKRPPNIGGRHLRANQERRARGDQLQARCPVSRAPAGPAPTRKTSSIGEGAPASGRCGRYRRRRGSG